MGELFEPLGNCLTCHELLSKEDALRIRDVSDDGKLLSLAEAVERTLLLEGGTSFTKENQLCDKCYTLFQELSQFELKVTLLREEIWVLYKATVAQRNQDVVDVIHGTAVQTEDGEDDASSTRDDAEMDDVGDLGVDNDGVKLECVESDAESVEGEKKWSGDQDDQEDQQEESREVITVDVDPQLTGDESKWPRWKRRPVACRFCGKWFKAKLEIDDHLLVHHRDQVLAQSEGIKANAAKKEEPAEEVISEKKNGRGRPSREKKDRPPKLIAIYHCRVCSKTLKSKPGAMYHAKSHNFSVGSKFCIEEAFRISYSKTDGEAIGEDESEAVEHTALIIVQSDAEQSSSSEDELPLAKRRKEFIFEKIRQEVQSEGDGKPRVPPKKALQTLKKCGVIQVTKVRPSSTTSGRKNNNDSEQRLENELSLEKVFETIENDELRSKISDLSKSSEVTIQKNAEMVRVRRKIPLSALMKLKRKRDLFPAVKEPKYKCDVCGKMWKTKGELNAHRTTHSDARPYICEICGQAYKHKPALDVHVGMHKGIYQHQCQFCNKAFTQKGALQRHLPIHTGDLPYQCELCGKRFVHRTSFSIHTMAHTGVRNIRCEICNMGVLSKSHLRRHMRIHSGEKPYECATCGKAFAERYNLVAHQRIHDPNLVGPARSQKRKPQTCRLCNAVFERRHKLEDHMVQAHNKVVEDPAQQGQSRPFETSEPFLSPRYVISESNASSKGESQNSEDAKEMPSVDLSMRGVHGLRNIDILRSTLDPTRGLELIRVANGMVETGHHWTYMNPNS